MLLELQEIIVKELKLFLKIFFLETYSVKL